jgi:hypothetical protein
MLLAILETINPNPRNTTSPASGNNKHVLKGYKPVNKSKSGTNNAQ